MSIDVIRETLQALLSIIIALIFCYTCRHYFFSLNRIYARQRHPYQMIPFADWPKVTIFVAAHNEEKVIGTSIENLLKVDYPPHLLQIIVVNDRSKDQTKEIVDAYIAKNPGRLEAFHRVDGMPGKPAALQDAFPMAKGEIFIFFDADYLPGERLIKQLVSPFYDPQIGLVMGRVIPINSASNLLTRLIELERTGGYQVDQQARMNLNLVPQYGGTVGGVRRSMLEMLGGWDMKALAEDTDITIRSLIKGYKTAYLNYSECYEESPEQWSVRIRQIKRWCKGHNQVFYHNFFKIFDPENEFIPLRQRFDGLMLLFLYLMSPLLVVGWMITLILVYISSEMPENEILFLCYMAFSSLGNFAAYFEIATGVHFDRGKQKLWLLPLNILNFIVSAVSITNASVSQLWQMITRHNKEHKWEKTIRYRKPDAPAAPPPAATGGAS
jgi:cellulose synthase/poly-beta-1,6-N-acetylglucosamine synthase-like glycosyltransferase